MTRYIALLRGINVGGKNKIIMADLKAITVRNTNTTLKLAKLSRHPNT